MKNSGKKEDRYKKLGEEGTSYLSMKSTFCINTYIRKNNREDKQRNSLHILCCQNHIYSESAAITEDQPLIYKIENN